MSQAHFPDLADKLAVVTGGGRGIGWATGRRLRAEGADVIIVDQALSAAPLTDAASGGMPGVVSGEVGARPGPLATVDRDDGMMFFPCDVTRRENIAALGTHLAERIPDILVCAAGIVRSGPAEEMAGADWDDVIAVNLTGLFDVCRTVGGLMLGRGEGSIVTIASMSALISNVPQKQVSYNASKAGVVHLTRTLAGEWASRGVRVNAVSPGYIGTDLTDAVMRDDPPLAAEWASRTPMGRIGTPDEVAELILFLASSASSFMTGSNVVIDGGYTVW